MTPRIHPGKHPAAPTLVELQQRVDAWIGQFEEGYWPPLSMLARLTEEVGELAREINHLYGHKPKKKEEPPAEKKDENPLADKIREMKEEKKEEKAEEKAEEKGEEKTAEAIQVAIEKRAYEFLAAANLVNPDGSIKPPPTLQKVAQEDIDRAALQLLEKAGYPVRWSK